MAKKPQRKGPWVHRFLVMAFATLFCVLLYWLLGFVVDDIGTWPEPNYIELEEQMLDPTLVKRQKTLFAQIAETETELSDLRAEQQVLQQSIATYERTLGQLSELQKMRLEKNAPSSKKEQLELTKSSERFFTTQAEYERLNEKLKQLTGRQRGLNQQKAALEKTLTEKRKPIQERHGELKRRHRFWVGVAKLAFLIPLMLVAVLLFVRERTGIYGPMVYAFGIALALWVFQVMHEYFPVKYFKYILILASLAVAVRILVYLLRMVAFPKRDWLLKQYREAYETFLCPICGYPIRRGPLKFMFWNRRSIKRLAVSPVEGADAHQPYTCPACSTQLFEPCPSCQAIRHSLLPSCEKCGATRPIGEE